MTAKNPTEDDPENLFLDVNRYEIQESAIFQEYSLEVLQRSLDEYKTLNIYERTSLAKNIDSIRMLYSKQSLYYQLLQVIAADNQDNQREILTYIKDLYHSKQEINLRAEIVNPLMKIITGLSLELKETGCLFLQQILPKMNLADRKDMIELANVFQKKQDEQSKIAALQIIARLSKDLSQAEVSQAFGKFFRETYIKGSVRLKKQIIHNCPLFAVGVSQEYFHIQILQQFYLEKCKEPIWGIRKACVQVLPRFVQLTKTKKQTLSATLLSFTKDGSKIVRLTAFKIIPQFIAHYDSTTVSNALFQLFCSLPKHQINKEVNRDNQIVQKIAFYLPGILQVCGTSKWPQIKGVMERLLEMKNQEVRLPLASSIHEITRIIGSGLASQVMFHVVDAFLKDQSQQLNLAVVRRFTDFMGVFDKNTRQNLIDFFLVLQNDPKKWRVRFQIARQLGLLTQYYEVDIIFQYIFPICLKLCNDTRSSVREQAASHMHIIVQKMKQNQAFQSSTIDSIICLGNSTVYRQRLTLAYMIGSMSRIAAFRKKMTEMLIQLAKDKVVGVRTALAHSLARCDKSKDWIVQFQSAINILSKDQEDCVRNELTL